MRGDNPIRPPVRGDGSRLEIKRIYATIQGEGPLAGTPAVFIRLGGCNLACDFCDTEFERFSPMALDEILAQARREAGGAQVPVRLAVITGGEPLRQPVGPLCDGLLAEGFAVQVETNGTLFRQIDARVSLVCSPKADARGHYHRLREDLLPRLDALKFVVSASHPHYREVDEVGQGAHGIPVYVQPMDEEDPVKNAANLAHAVHLAQARGYRLSLQLHKLIGVE